MKFAAALSFLFLSCSAFLMADNAALAAKAREQIGVTTSYDGSYQVIPYPNGMFPRTRAYARTWSSAPCGHSAWTSRKRCTRT